VLGSLFIKTSDAVADAVLDNGKHSMKRTTIENKFISAKTLLLLVVLVDCLVTVDNVLTFPIMPRDKTEIKSLD